MTTIKELHERYLLEGRCIAISQKPWHKDKIHYVFYEPVQRKAVL